MLVDTLLLSAECYDVMVECAYENPAENFLNYGNVKVNSTVVREMYMLNRGRYNVYYKLVNVFEIMRIIYVKIIIIPVSIPLSQAQKREEV